MNGPSNKDLGDIIKKHVYATSPTSTIHGVEKAVSEIIETYFPQNTTVPLAGSKIYPKSEIVNDL